MTDIEQWPPRSPLKTLLSSPSGRKRYRDYQTSNLTSVSPNKLLGSPSLLEKLRAARADRDAEFLEVQQQEEDEEDEEMLQLKLQAIEAKLKLKRLKQQKARDAENLRPQSSHSSILPARVEVALSPTRRVAVSIPKSPSRVTLGIDKGIGAANMSLKRPRILNTKTTNYQDQHTGIQLPKSSSSSTLVSCLSNGTSATVKSFSERMADFRGRERDQEEKRSVTQSSRSTGFKIDKTEVEEYHDAARVPSAVGPKKVKGKRHVSPTPRTDVSRGDSDLGRDNGVPAQSKTLKHSRSMPSIRSTSPSKSDAIAHPASDDVDIAAEEPKGDATLYEPFSNTHLSARILPHTFLKRTLPGGQFEIFNLPRLLKTVTSPAYQMPDEITDYVVFGIIASKSSPRDHKPRTTDTKSTSSKDWEKKWDDGTMNKQKFMVLTLTDLKWTVDLFLFDTAVPRYHRLTPGTLIAILNPSVMPPKRGREDTGAFSLAIHNGEDQILEIGKAKHLAYCTAKRKDGQPCGSWIDGSKTEICEWHLSAELDRARSKRMGVNSMGGTNGSKRNGEKNFSHGFNYEAQTFYYAVGGSAPKRQGNAQWSFAPTYNSSLSTAKLLDSTNPDDPFIASGQLLERDKQDRLRKQMMAQEKEREIARKLGGLGHKGGAGGEYFKQRTADPTTTKPSTGVTSGPGITVDDIMRNRPGDSKKRAAETVRLSPVKKKTRFVTSNGIKEAGRESIGVGAGVVVKAMLQETRRHDFDDDDDDDDDLDIV